MRVHKEYLVQACFRLKTEKTESNQQVQVHPILKQAQTYVKLQGPFLGQISISIWILPKFDGIEFQADTSLEVTHLHVTYILHGRIKCIAMYNTNKLYLSPMETYIFLLYYKSSKTKKLY